MLKKHPLPLAGAVAGVIALAAGAPAQEEPTAKPFSGIMPPPGKYTTSWIGNTFGGAGGPNGSGYWVQNGADEIEVAPDGTVFAGMDWDEAGRCVGLYRDGQVNRVLLKVPREHGDESAWGWGTGNRALTVSGSEIFIANTGKRLLRFRWKPGDLNSGEFVEQTTLGAEAVGLNARDGRLVVVYQDGGIELRSARDLKATGRFEVRGARDAVFAADGRLWVLAGDTIQQYSTGGKTQGRALPDLQKPTALAIDNRGRLIVTDDGPRQQVLFFDLLPSPRLVASFGEKRGLLSGTPGIVAPKKLFALTGAGTDAQGNLYVGLSCGNGPAGNLFLRSFSPKGDLRWEVMSTAFVDTFGFDPTSDGAAVYSRTAAFDLNLSRTQPGSEWKLKAITLDHLHHPDDPRLKHGSTAILRRLQGRRLLYIIGQYAGGYRLYTFDEPNGYTARPAGQILATKEEGEQWAWYVAENGDIWHGDAPGKTIRRYAFQGWTKDGRPRFDWRSPHSWPWPEGWKIIRRVLYDQHSDTLYLTGYQEGDRVETWGVTGRTVRRYDGWLKGGKTLRWSIETPHDGNPDAKEGPLSPSSVCVAGDYLFFGMVKPTNNRQYVHIFRSANGQYAGSFQPGLSVVTPGTEPGVGWLDMPYSTQAMRRKNGEYLILVEEDWRGKNLHYRWNPGRSPAERP